MKILANDGISLAGKIMLEKEGFEVLVTFVAQDQLANFINENNIEVLLVRSATKVRQDLIDATNLKIIGRGGVGMDNIDRSEEHTSELQSRENLVCRLLLEK